MVPSFTKMLKLNGQGVTHKLPFILHTVSYYFLSFIHHISWIFHVFVSSYPSELVIMTFHIDYVCNNTSKDLLGSSLLLLQLILYDVLPLHQELWFYNTNKIPLFHFLKPSNFSPVHNHSIHFYVLATSFVTWHLQLSSTHITRCP